MTKSDATGSIPDVSIVIPCYLEEKHLLDSLHRISKVMADTSYKFEIILVEDAGTDNTKELILLAEKEFSNIQHVFHEKNEGKGKCIADGALQSRGRIIGHIDIDLEVSAQYIPALLQELEKGSDIALIDRQVKFSMIPGTLLRDMAGKLHRKVVQRLLNIPYIDVQSGCKFFRGEVLLELLEETRSPGWFFDAELMAHAHHDGYKIAQLPGLYIRSKTKRSTVNLFSDGWKQAIDLWKLSGKLKKEKTT